MNFKIKKQRACLLLTLVLTTGNFLTGTLSKADYSDKPQDIDNKKTRIYNSENNLLLQDYYIIGPGDILELRLFDAPEFSGNYKVLNDGSVNLPLIGNFSINNLTIKKASDLVQKKYGKQLLRPELYMTIKSPRPLKVSIIGEVQRPGLYSLTNNETTQLEEDKIILPFSTSKTWP